jgi:UDP-glucose 6-dehydrogenase
MTSPGDVIAIIGTSYKPGTAFAEESQALGIARILVGDGHAIHVYNPSGNDHTRQLLSNAVTYHENLLSCLEQASLVFLGLPLTRDVRESLERCIQEKKIKFVDPWRQLKRMIW